MSKIRYMAKHYWKENEFVRAEQQLCAMPKSPWRRIPVGSPAVERQVRDKAHWRRVWLNARRWYRSSSIGWPRGKGGVPGGKWASQKRAAENTRFLLSRLESDNARVMGHGVPFQRHAIE